MNKYLNIKALKFKIMALLISLAAGYWLPATPAQAQSLSLSLWPPLLEVMIQPGKSITQVYKLTNNSDHDLEITPQVFPFEPKGELGQIEINFSPPPSLAPAPFFSFASREKFNQPFSLATGETKELVLKIAINQNNQEKDYYYTLLFSTAEEPLNPSTQEEGKSGAIVRVGSNILITTSQLGKPPLLGKITSFSLPLIIDSFSPLTPKVVLENWGKTLWKPFGQIEIWGPFQQKNEIKLKEQNVLANSSRQLDIESFSPRWPIGPFKAKLEFSLNEDGQKLSSETSFWYLPYKLVGAIMVLAALGFLIKRVKKDKTQNCQV